MDKSLKSCIFIFITICFFSIPTSLWAQNSSIELNINTSDIEFKAETALGISDEPNLYLGGDILYTDDYKFIKGICLLKDHALTDGLRLGLGFNGIFGENEISHYDYNIAAIGFTLFGEFDLRKAVTDKVPLSFSITASISPDPLCFSDTERYSDINFSTYFYVLDNAAIVAGYRNLSMRFEKNGHTLKSSDDTLFFGVKLTF